ncbi:phosphatidylcholine:ceramide cholinephosphotransferase 2-like isoform X2 [Sipha flava]|nr:phosphatidylcholine:ceramide cholinephosphotransferase 2-like isoform X2 [Sipha flava]XP_025420931.1 phosphatidylcholine:ceramide cholinephosphotransferase 2-like isoform X2 [Sipha flava]XP_025420932.1 phosphatidylcholine:ceramide cholinephosphotransferase 2-like isoform X2 [Sipha flava]
MVLEPKREANTDGIENRIQNKGVFYTCNENHKKDYVRIKIDMPPANGHLNERQRQPLLGLCKQVTSAVSNGIGWEPRNDNIDVNGENREHQQPVMGHIHQTLADNKHQLDGGVSSTGNDGFNHKYLNNNANGTAVHIDMPNNVNPPPSNDKIRIPQEKFKTFVALILLIMNFLITTTSLAVVHERVPDRNLYKPLPDTFLDAVPARDWALDVSEVFIIISTNLSLLIIASHKYRFIVLRRLMFMLSLLYLLRSVTMFVTVLPISSTTYYCSPKSNSTSPEQIAKRVFQLFSGFGLSINGKHTFCGDYMYSGHTTILVMSYLIIVEYSPRRWYLLHWASWLMGAVGVLMVLIAHGHYTIDVIIAYLVTTRLFWIYHTLANNVYLKHSSSNNYLARSWWFWLFKYFEGNINGPIPRQYDWPLPWPQHFTTAKYRNRDS